MSNCSRHFHPCGQCGPWISCSGSWGCGQTCGCTAADGTPACNPCAPWGQTAGLSVCQCSHCACRGCSTCDGSCGCNACDSGCGDCSGVTQGYLVPRITSIGRTFQRRITQTLCPQDLPETAEAPLTLVSVTVSGQASWEQISECRQQLLRVTVPVALQIRDCAGRCRTAHSTVMLTIPLCRHCPAQELWRGQLYVAPCIRLAAPVTENEDGCFDATLEVQAEVYLVRMQVVNA